QRRFRGALGPRPGTARDSGIQARAPRELAEAGRKGRVLTAADRRSSYERIAQALAGEHGVDVEVNPHDALFHAADGDYDLLMVSLDLDGFDGLRLCSQVRSLERTRNLPILIVVEAEDNVRLLRGLEIGVNDYLVRPIDKNEMLARARTQIRKKRYGDKLRDNLQLSM